MRIRIGRIRENRNYIIIIIRSLFFCAACAVRQRGKNVSLTTTTDGEGKPRRGGIKRDMAKISRVTPITIIKSPRRFANRRTR